MYRHQIAALRRRARHYTSRVERRARGRLTEGEAYDLGARLAENYGSIGCSDRIALRTRGSFARDWAEFPRERAGLFRELRGGINHPFAAYGPRYGWTF